MGPTEHWRTNPIDQEDWEASNKTYLVHFGSMPFAHLIGAKEHIPGILISVVRDHDNHLLVGGRDSLEMVTHDSGPVRNGDVCAEIERDWDQMKPASSKVILKGSIDHGDMCLDANADEAKVEEQHSGVEDLSNCSHLKVPLDVQKRWQYWLTTTSKSLRTQDDIHGHENHEHEEGEYMHKVWTSSHTSFEVAWDTEKLDVAA